MVEGEEIYKDVGIYSLVSLREPPVMIQAADPLSTPPSCTLSREECKVLILGGFAKIVVYSRLS